MELQEAFDKRLPIAVKNAQGTSLCSHAFVDARRRLVTWAWPGWLVEVGGHPVHVERGTVDGDGPWQVGEATFFELSEADDTQNDMWVQYINMLAFEESADISYKAAVELLKNG